MSKQQPFYVYQYDGSFSGFLCCVFESYVNREIPMDFFAGEDAQTSLYPCRAVVTDSAHADRVYRSLAEKISPAARNLVARGFLSCVPERDRILYRFIRWGYAVGSAVTGQFSHPDVEPLIKIARHVTNEAQLLRGFVRFSQVGGALAAEIEPKNRVLPLLRQHFCERYADEVFLIYDRIHKEALFYRPDRWAILPLEGFRMAGPDEEEAEFRSLWKRFYNQIAIKERYNPKCRMSHMPKRYWNTMTEFIPDTRNAAADVPQPDAPDGKLVPVKRP